MRKNIILSFETAIEGGSISILEGEREIDFWVGIGKVSKAENVLDEIQKLLNKNQIKKTDISLITVSSGQGSYTGVRNGMATALGLKAALGCKFSSASALDAMTLMFETNGKSLTAVPAGRGQICQQVYKVPSIDSPQIIETATLLSKEKFVEELQNINLNEIVLHPKLIEDLCDDNELPEKISVLNSGNNLAYLIAIKARSFENQNASDNVEIIYPAKKG